jgi:hypothetical protein
MTKLQLPPEDSHPNASSPSPSPADPRRAYETPELIRYGSLTQLTRTVNMAGVDDNQKGQGNDMT